MTRYQVETYGEGAWTDCDALGVSGLRLTLRSGGMDELAVTLEGAAALTAAEGVFAYGNVLRLRRVPAGGAPEILFCGAAQGLARSGSGASESATCSVLGWWWWMERTVYRQSWREADDTVVYAPHVVLFCAADGSRVATGPQLAAAVDECVAAGAPLQRAASWPSGWTPPCDEQLNLTCAQAASRCMQMHPRLCLWCDYSTTPPTVRASDAAALPASDVALPALASLEIRRRDDLAPPAVALAYVRHVTDGERAYVRTEIDAAPAVQGETAAARAERLRAPGVLWGVYEMDGPTSQYEEAEVEVEAVGWAANKARASWWQARCPEIADAAVLALSDQSCSGGYANFLAKGSLPEWAHRHTDETEFSCRALIRRSASDGGVSEELWVDCRFTAVTTDSSSRAYRRRVSYDSGELTPPGLAAEIYAEFSVPVWEGRLAIAADDAPALPAPGRRLRVSGGAPAWAAMDALVTEARIDLSAGTLEASFGASRWCDLDSRVAWARQVRGRRFSWSRNMRGGGYAGDDPGADAAPATAGGAASSTWLRLRLRDPSAATAHECDLDIRDPSLAADASARAIKFRKLKCLVDEGTASAPALAARDVWVLASEPFGPSSPIGSLDIRYDPVSHQLQKSADGGLTWTMVVGGQAVEETV